MDNKDKLHQKNELLKDDLLKDKLQKKVEQQAKRIKQAEEDQPNLMGYTIYIGTLGLLFILPVVVAVYVGNWLDSRAEGYSSEWTINLIFIGIFIGAFNVYMFIKE